MSQSKSSLAPIQITILTLVVLATIVGFFVFMIRIQVNNKDAGLRNQAKLSKLKI